LLAPGGPAPVRAFATALVRCAESGAAPAAVLRAVADDARAAARTAGEAAARRAAAAAVLPLGLCFLPAFVLAGVVPLVAGLLAGTL
jgi:pilus assembly protein TadC